VIGKYLSDEMGYDVNPTFAYGGSRTVIYSERPIYIKVSW